MSDIVIYEDGQVELKIEFDGHTIWLRENEIAKIFDKKSNVQKMHIASSDKPITFSSKAYYE